MSDRGRFRVSYAARVAAQMDVALAWWRRHRLQAPVLLLDEIDVALDIVARVPQAGRRMELRGYENVRRLLLPRTSYHLYYRVDLEILEVQLLAFRHSRRKPPRR